MKIRSATDYLAQNYPVLHFPKEWVSAASLHSMSDVVDSVFLTFKQEDFTDEEYEMLINNLLK